MKKKLLALILGMAMVLSMTACGGSDDAAADQPASTGNEAAAQAADPAAEVEYLTGALSILTGAEERLTAEYNVDDMDATIAMITELSQTTGNLYLEMSDMQWSDENAELAQAVYDAAFNFNQTTVKYVAGLQAEDEATVEEGAAFFETYMTDMDTALTLLGV